MYRHRQYVTRHYWDTISRGHQSSVISHHWVNIVSQYHLHWVINGLGIGIGHWHYCHNTVIRRQYHQCCHNRYRHFSTGSLVTIGSLMPRCHCHYHRRAMPGQSFRPSRANTTSSLEIAYRSVASIPALSRRWPSFAITRGQPSMSIPSFRGMISTLIGLTFHTISILPLPIRHHWYVKYWLRANISPRPRHLGQLLGRHTLVYRRYCRAAFLLLQYNAGPPHQQIVTFQMLWSITTSNTHLACLEGPGMNNAWSNGNGVVMDTDTFTPDGPPPAQANGLPQRGHTLSLIFIGFIAVIDAITFSCHHAAFLLSASLSYCCILGRLLAYYADVYSHRLVGFIYAIITLILAIKHYWFY